MIKWGETPGLGEECGLENVADDVVALVVEVMLVRLWVAATCEAFPVHTDPLFSMRIT